MQKYATRCLYSWFFPVFPFSILLQVETSATGLFGKPKLSGVEASIEQKQTAAGIFKVDPPLLVTAESQAAVSAAQLEKRAPSGVIISAQTLADVDPKALSAVARQNTTVSDFENTLKTPIPNAKQNQTTFGQVAAADLKNGTIVFQDSVFEP